MTNDPLPLRPLHPDESLSPAKLLSYNHFGTEELVESLKPGGSEALRERPDGTILNGHHRIRIHRGCGVDVDRLPHEVVEMRDSPA
jgi:hypothetical protein